MNIISDSDITVHQINTQCLAQFSYIIHSGQNLVIIDPLRDTDMYINYIKEHIPDGVEQGHILVTHYHADFVSGYRHLAELLGCEIIFGPNANPDFECHVAKDEEKIMLSDKYWLRVMHTPGHTLESTSFELCTDEKHVAVFTGDALFLGDVGRPDLAQKGELTKEGLAKMLFASLKKLKALPDDTLVLPGHGAGSSCGKNISKGTVCTIGIQKEKNVAFKHENEEEFIDMVTHGLDVPPPYFAHNVAMNKAHTIPTNEELYEKVFNKLTLEQFESELSQPNTYVLDCRPMTEFDVGHVAGSLWVPLKGNFAIWSAYLLKPDDRILLICPESKEHEAHTRLLRTGLDKCVGYLEGGFDTWKSSHSDEIETLSSVDINDVTDFSSKLDGKQLLDVRGLGEWNNGIVGHEPPTHLLQLQLLRPRLDEQQQADVEEATLKEPVAVYCGGGTRSRIAYSLLKNRGYSNLTNINGGYRGLTQNGIKVVPKSAGQKCSLI